MMRYVFFLIGNLFCLSLGLAQVVWTEPPFPTQFDDITVYYDATQGNAALAGFTGDVYAHTGVITTESAAPNDWKHVQGVWGTADANTLMTREGDDLYSLSYNIEEYYGISAGEVVEQLAFVFRDSDGSIVGREADGSDIFTEVYPPQEGLLVNVITPSTDNTVLLLGDSLLVQFQINTRAQVRIFDNTNLVWEDSTDAAALYVYPTTEGAHTLTIEVQKDDFEEVITRRYFVINDNGQMLDVPITTQEGINYYTDTSYLFRLTAPFKKHVFLLCPANDYEVNLDYRMNQTPDSTTFWIEIPKSRFQDGRTTYQYLVDGNIRIADPYATVVLDPSNDTGVPNDVLATLPPYPEGKTSGIVTAFDAEKTVYDWQTSVFEKPAKEDLVVYELLMRDFLEDKNYKSLLDTLDYLQYLGVNAIELMPIQEFEGNQSWGYNPSFHMAVDKYYGSRDQLRAVIDEAHRRGIAVILDVVFNHAFSQSPLCQMYWDVASFRPAPDNPWLNVVPRHPFNVGYDFNHESPYTRQWVKQVLQYWLEEFRFDGFRFDLSKGLTQLNSGNNSDLMAQYDAGRIAILKDYADWVWSIDDTAYVILEHFAYNDEERELADYGMMLWGNSSFDFAKAARGNPSNVSSADYRARNWTQPHLMAYIESHDEERLGYELQEQGIVFDDYNVQELATAVERVAAANAVFLSLPGPKMLWQFGELNYDFSINRCTDGTVDPSCRLDPKPIRWDYLEDTPRADLLERMAALIHLKTNYPTFATDDYTFEEDSYIKRVQLNHPDMDVVTLANFRTRPQMVTPDFPYSGTWYDYLTGESIDVTDTQMNMEYAPGEYHIYTSRKISPPNGYFEPSSPESAYPPLVLFPNPARVGETVQVTLPESIDITTFRLWNMLGIEQYVTWEVHAQTLSFEVPALAAGVYWVSFKQGTDFWTERIIVSQ